MKQEFLLTVYHSPLGPVRILCDRNSVIAVGFNESDQGFRKRHRKVAPGIWQEVPASKNTLLARITQALDEFFSGKGTLPDDLPLKPSGSVFQRKVWNELLKIPSGRTVTYGEIAVKVGSPGASRAVGAACGANPIPLFIPCHRVIGSSGSLCGFGGGGIEIKKQLIEMESGVHQLKFC